MLHSVAEDEKAGMGVINPFPHVGTANDAVADKSTTRGKKKGTDTSGAEERKKRDDCERDEEGRPIPCDPSAPHSRDPCRDFVKAEILYQIREPAYRIPAYSGLLTCF